MQLPTPRNLLRSVVFSFYGLGRGANQSSKSETVDDIHKD